MPRVCTTKIYCMTVWCITRKLSLLYGKYNINHKFRYLPEIGISFSSASVVDEQSRERRGDHASDAAVYPLHAVVGLLLSHDGYHRTFEHRERCAADNANEYSHLHRKIRYYRCKDIDKCRVSRSPSDAELGRPGSLAGDLGKRLAIIEDFGCVYKIKVLIVITTNLFLF